MKTALLAILIGAGTIIAEAKQYTSFRAHVEATVNDGPVFSNQLQLFGRTVTLEKIPTLSERDVVGFQSYRASGGTHGVLFVLNDHGRLALDTLSVELRVDRRITDGKIYIPSGLTANDLELLKKDWPPRPKR